MRFSVVITTYNRYNLLQRAIDSARNQTINCEVVVADDCSSDATEIYVKSLGDYVIYHRNSVNQGHAATVNAGVAKASGDWIKFLDDDDYLAPNCLEQMATAILAHPNAVICSCVAAQVNGKQAELSRTPRLGPGLAYYIPQADIHYGMLLEVVPFGTPVQVACRRDTFMHSGRWDSSLDANCDDIDSWIRISQFGDAVFLNQCLAYRTVWTGAYNQKISLSQRLNTNILMKEKIYSLVNQQHRSELPEFQYIKTYIKLHWYLVALKQRNIKSLLLMLELSVVFSPVAWRILLTAALSRRSPVQNCHIRKLVLIES
ncbi:glycosyl transferase [Cylindrospermum stagnale PCC 7417]|uniref:Glycosyl transferase n=1 Tax=Cylindrospermum stagnale PCC 7417 TaxID=56107 RepID=K9X524_9NOST|nr:glycosyltransferase family 2 protein [Cylindrospermum stagnale]AFZ27204.1 glycosyl transferase [Cylindrospermum stagnale PCC 7417]